MPPRACIPEDELRTLAAQGLSINAIGIRLGFCYISVARAMDRLNIERPRFRHERWTHERDMRLRSMVADNRTIRFMAKDLGITTQRTTTRLKKLDLLGPLREAKAKRAISQESLIVEEYRKGTSVKAIENKFNTTYLTIKKVATEAKVPLRPYKPRSKTEVMPTTEEFNQYLVRQHIVYFKSVPDLARELQVDVRAVENRFQKLGVSTWVPTYKGNVPQALLYYCHDFMSHQEAARRAGVSDQTVKLWIDRLNVRRSENELSLRYAQGVHTYFADDKPSPMQTITPQQRELINKHYDEIKKQVQHRIKRIPRLLKYRRRLGLSYSDVVDECMSTLPSIIQSYDDSYDFVPYAVGTCVFRYLDDIRSESKKTRTMVQRRVLYKKAEDLMVKSGWKLTLNEAIQHVAEANGDDPDRIVRDSKMHEVAMTDLEWTNYSSAYESEELNAFVLSTNDAPVSDWEFSKLNMVKWLLINWKTSHLMDAPLILMYLIPLSESESPLWSMVDIGKRSGVSDSRVCQRLRQELGPVISAMVRCPDKICLTAA